MKQKSRFTVKLLSSRQTHASKKLLWTPILKNPNNNFTQPQTLFGEPRKLQPLPKTLSANAIECCSKETNHNMVYCPKCGTKNEDTATTCTNCGANLQTGTYQSRRWERRRAEQECFGLPHGGAIVGIAIGLIVLFWGIITLAQQSGLIAQNVEIWPFAIIIFGILVLVGALYSLSRRRPPS